MDPSLTHKRSKSSRVLNLVRRGDGTKDNMSDSGSPTESIGRSTLNAPSTKDNRLTQTVTNTTTSQAAMESTTSVLAGNEQRQAPPTGLPSAPSIEDSVRTFRVFEALRGKDPAAISKAISDSDPTPTNPVPIPGTTILHLAIQCAEPHVVDQVLKTAKGLDVNAQDRDGNTPLHLAAQLGRASVVAHLLELPGVNDTLINRAGKAPIDTARTPEIFSQLQLARSLFLDNVIKQIQAAVQKGDHKKVEELFVEPRVEAALDVNALELATDQLTIASGGTLLHEAARKRDLQLCQLLLLHGADPFRRDRKGKLPQDVTKDDRTRAILKKSPAAAAAQRGIQEKAILGNNPGAGIGVGDYSKDAREMQGYLKKWTNYTSGYKLRWFVLENGVLSYYKHQDDAGSACRGAINMRIARLQMDAQDKTRFEIQGKSSVKYHLKANHVVEAKRWFWSLNNAIQYSKDEAKEEAKQRLRDVDAFRQAKVEATDHADVAATPRKQSVAGLGVPVSTSKLSVRSEAGEGSINDSYEPSLTGDEAIRAPTVGTATVNGDDIDAEDASSHEISHPGSKDAFNITAQSAKLQLDLLGSVASALQAKSTDNPELKISDSEVVQAISTYETAVSSLNGLIRDLLKISRDRDAYWQYRLDRDADARKMWEESMAQIAFEHEELKKHIFESEEKRKRTKKALKEALEGQAQTPGVDDSKAPTQGIQFAPGTNDLPIRPEAKELARKRSMSNRSQRRKSVIVEYTNLSDSDSDEDEEFFDAIDAGEIEVVVPQVTSPSLLPAATSAGAAGMEDVRTQKHRSIEPSFAGYESGIRHRLKMDADDRPKISLWGILKSMIGKDMTKMTLPVSFNEPTSLLQRVAEDMEYADLLDIAADRPTSLERLVYIAAFAASEYASTIGRVAKPFNPLLGETYEYVRPDKGYRFFIEQVSHHPPIGAALAESARWDYWGESAVKSKFYGKSFDINPLGTWFLRLRTSDGKSELYTWKKVTSSVVGIITGNPVVDQYGPMEIKNWNTGEVCLLEFKQRGWKASSAYQVSGKVMDQDGVTKWSIGGRWNDKIYARVTEGYEDDAVGEGKSKGSNQAILVWQAHERPTGIPFNLTPFVVTLNDPNEQLLKHIPPTDTRLRPDQRAMEDGEYDFAATEKNRVEEKQRAARRERENAGDVWEPKWFTKDRDPITGESYWKSNGRYWENRKANNWSACDDIF